MPPRKTQRQLADEAYLRMEQMTIEEGATPAPTREPPQLTEIPSACPECGKKWSAAGGVTALTSEHRQYTFFGQIQCGSCGNVFLVDRADHEKLHAAIVADGKARIRPPLPHKTRGKRERGAG